MIDRLYQELEQLRDAIEQLKEQRDALVCELEYITFKIKVIEESEYYQQWRGMVEPQLEELYRLLGEGKLEKEKLEAQMIRSDMVCRILERYVQERENVVG